ncbi:cache domain-containing sensor histidine kinase [Neobacillus dielmonensis]|uniref:cache domain-containing sensor histidine kinase n=1 Tax=Neobacillus dielmonensis TaxID=1347369 RepID=UPI0005A94FAF|nr:sensor histidine kinase [Neobacillus dielmonensis]
MNPVFHYLARRFTNKSIQNQLLLTYTLVILVPILLFAVFSYVTSSRIITKEVNQSNVQLIEGIKKNIGLYLKRLDNDSKVFSARVINNNIDLSPEKSLSNVDFLENNKEITDYLNSTFDSTKDYYNIRIFSDKGDFITSAYNRKDYRLISYNSPEEKIWNQRMLRNDQEELIYDVHRLEQGGKLSFVASKPVINQFNHKRIGYISFDKTLESFGSIFRQFENRKGSVVQVINADHTVLYHTNSSRIGTNVNPHLLSRVLKSKESSFTAKVDGEKLLIVSSKLNDQGLLIIGSVQQKYLSNQLQSLKYFTFIIGITALMVVFILSIILSIRISRPIKKLSEIMSVVEKGNLEVDMNVPKANVETEVLKRSFQSMLDKIKELIRTQYESEINRKNAELKALLMQINPHFLYNTLEVIEGIADDKGVYEISDISQSLSKMLRYSIDLKQEKVKLQYEIQNCLDFFLILKSRFEDQLIIEHEIEPDVVNFMIVKMVLQPLVENSIKHGVEKKFGQGFIRLTIKKEAENVVLALEDNGVGFAEEKLREFQQFRKQQDVVSYFPSNTKSLGLKNVYARLRMVYGEQLYFAIDSVSGQGTLITIKFPALESGGGHDG